MYALNFLFFFSSGFTLIEDKQVLLSETAERVSAYVSCVISFNNFTSNETAINLNKTEIHQKTRGKYLINLSCIHIVSTNSPYFF